MDASLDAAQLSVSDVQRRASPLRAAAIADQAILAASGAGALNRLSASSACSASSSPMSRVEANADAAPAAVLGMEAPAREVPIGLMDQFLGEQMMRAQLRARCETALREVCVATLRLREARRRRGSLRAEYEGMGAAGRRAVETAAPELLLAARMLECRPLPLCAPGDGWSLDEATAAAEAMALCQSAAKGKRGKFLVSEGTHPQTIDVVRTRAKSRGWEIVVEDHRELRFDDDVFGVLLQYPATDGALHDYRDVVAAPPRSAGAAT
jgi:hypothetical protein